MNTQLTIDSDDLPLEEIPNSIVGGYIHFVAYDETNFIPRLKGTFEAKFATITGSNMDFPSEALEAFHLLHGPAVTGTPREDGWYCGPTLDFTFGPASNFKRFEIAARDVAQFFSHHLEAPMFVIRGEDEVLGLYFKGARIPLPGL